MTKNKKNKTETTKPAKNKSTKEVGLVKLASITTTTVAKKKKDPSDDIKFLYVRDPFNDRRVLTIARKLDSNKKSISFQVAINCIRGRVVDENGVRVESDVFRKDIGRNVSSGRLAKNPIVVKLKKDARPIETVMNAILKTDSTMSEMITARKVVKNHVRVTEIIEQFQKDMNVQTFVKIEQAT